MARIITTEGRMPEESRGRALIRTVAGLKARTHLDARMGMHLAVVVIVASSLVLGGHLSGGPSRDRLSVAVAPTPPGLPVPTVDAMTPSYFATPKPGTVASASVPSGPVSPTGAAGPMHSALSLSTDLLQDSSSKGEDGVVAVRASVSSRGGSRAPEPTPTPTPTPAPTPTPTPPKKEPLKPQTYQVVAGDTLLRIAYRFGITPETVLAANGLGNADMLQIGQELTILPVSGVLHRVKKGDTLAGISEAYLADPAKVLEANLLPDPDQLQEGQVLVIPGGMLRTTEIVGLPSAPSQQELAAAPKYTVKAGDTLASIADSYGVRISTIQVANSLLNPDALAIGQVLSIPGGKQRAGADPQPAAQKPEPARAAPAPAPAKPAPEPEAAAGGSAGDRVAAISQKYLGYRYVWGGHSPSGFDCSGYTWYVYKEAGIGIPIHDLAGQLNAGPRISRDKLLPGDLVFFQNTYKAGLSHSGIYLGGGRFINAESEAVGVQIRSLNDPFWSARFLGGSRPW